MSAPNARHLPHFPALDGLRGLAVLGVLAFHADGALPGGYLGVDLFFVLSGYLITSILLAGHATTGRVDLGEFWVRRARRLFPAVLALLAAIAVYGKLFARPAELHALRGDAVATLLYVANWRAIFTNKSYWDLFLAPSPLEHTWSLAIEEQFYVVWPLVVGLVLVVLRRSRRALFFVSVALALASAATMLLLYDEDDVSRVYLGTDTRASGILLGAALAAVLPPGTALSALGARVLGASSVAAVAGLGVAWSLVEGEGPFLYHGGFWLTELCALVLIACGASTPNAAVARALGFRPLLWTGTISYGVYLWHWPIYCVLTPERLHTGATATIAIRLAVTFAVAAVSYVALEKPIRTRGVFFGPAALVVPAAALSSLFLVYVATVAPPAPPPAPKPPPVVATASAAPTEPQYPGVFSVESRALPPKEALKPGTLRILVLGDSVATKLGLALRYRQGEFDAFVAERGVGDCTILESPGSGAGGNRPRQGNVCSEHWASDVDDLRPDMTFIVLGGGYYSRTRLNGGSQYACQHPFPETYAARLSSLVSSIEKNAGRIVIALVPYPLGRWRSRGLLERVDCFNGILRDVAHAKKIPAIDLMTHVCPTKDCNLVSDGEPIRPDGLHFDGVGAEETARWTLHGLKALTDPALALTR